jgi:hypothetical protein
VADPSNGTPLWPTASVPRPALATLQWRHLRTVIDPALAAAPSAPSPSQPGPLAGFTEWSAPWSTTQAYVSWKWAVLRGTLIVLDPAALRTNIMITEDGRPVAHAHNILHLFEWIETLPWRPAVGRAIAST